MINSKLILGADVRENTITLSCCLDQQKELLNETYPLEKQCDGEEIADRIKQFLNKNHMGRQADYLVYSCDDYPMSRCKKLEKMLKQKGIGQKGIWLISRESAFVYYVMNQKEELYKHTVVAFEYDGKQLSGYRLYYPNRKEEHELKTEKKIIGTLLMNQEQPGSGKLLDQKFAEVSKKILSKEVVSAVFLTGQGFEGGWMQKSLGVLCDGRRAFFGQNLFSAGCCYYGVILCQNIKTNYFIQAPETVLYESGVLDAGCGDAFVSVTKAGCAWYETKGSIDVIMERGPRVDIVFVHTQTREKQVESVDVSGLPPRMRKTGRLKIRVEFSDKNHGVITVTDKGFGAFAPATHQVFFKEFELL